MNSFLAELRKIWSIRSTYVLIVGSLLLAVGLLSFWVFGYQNSNGAQASPNALQLTIVQSVSLGALLLSFVAVLSVGHEYRYNTILYTLTLARQRTSVLVAKLSALLVFMIAATAVLVGLTIAAFTIGQNIKGIDTIAQTVPIWETTWRVLGIALGNIVFAFAITMLLRSLIGAIAFVLLVPTTIESLLGIVLKDNVQYLPYTALNRLAENSVNSNYAMNLAVVGVYAAALLLVSGVVFWRRDAN